MKGFSLVEIIVVVAIMAVMASSVVIAFGSFETTVRVRETAGTITDIIKNLELDMIRRDYIKQTVRFAEDYLISEAEVENQTLSLDYVLGPGCPAGEEKLIPNNLSSATPAFLAQRDALGNNLSIQVIPGSSNEKVCVPFYNSAETEWQYQLFRGGEVSQVIRFLHFNLRREDPESTQTKITEGTNYTLQITAPYADKSFYDAGVLTADEVNLVVKSFDGEVSETLTLQE